MNYKLITKLLPALIHSKGQVEITVTGISMNPTLYEGDRILIQPCDTYTPGDILVYFYKNEGLLVHRLLRIDHPFPDRTDLRFYCKGDNSFRLEDLSENEIIGKVLSLNGHSLPSWPDWKLQLSYNVHQQFVRCSYDIPQTKLTNTYRLYNALVLRKECDYITYAKNPKMDFIYTSETALAVFDTRKNTTQSFAEIGIGILNVLDSPCTLDTLLQGLCQIYGAQPDEIRADVEEFLANYIQREVVLICP